MTGRLRLLALLACAAVAIALYAARIRHEMIDFSTWRQMTIRAVHAEPLYRAEDGHFQFKYLPLFALIMSPFGLIDLETGKVLWFAISIGLLTLLLRWSVSALPDRRLSRAVLIAWAMVLMAKFIAHELVLGQVNLLLGAMLLAGLTSVQAKRPLTAGTLVGAAAFVKPYALILVPWLFVAQGWRPAAAAGATIAAGLLLPALVYGWTGNLDLLRGWVATVADSTTPNLLGSDNVSVASMWAKWLGPGATASALTIVTLVAVGGLVLLAWQRRRTVSAPDYLECALLMLLIPLISPQGWDYVLLLATPAVICLVDRWRELDRFWRGGLAGALAVMCLTIFDIMGRALYARFMALAFVSVSALAVAAVLVHTRWRGLA